MYTVHCRKKKKVTFDTVSHITPDMLHVTRGMRHMVGGEHSLKISAPNLLRFGMDSVLEILNKRITYQMNELIINEGVYRTALATRGL